MATTLKLTHVAIYDANQGLIWGYGDTAENAWADAVQEYANDGFSGDPREECNAIHCSKALAESGLGGELDFVIVPVKGALGLFGREITGAVTADEFGQFDGFEAP